MKGDESCDFCWGSGTYQGEPDGKACEATHAQKMPNVDGPVPVPEWLHTPHGSAKEVGKCYVPAYTPMQEETEEKERQDITQRRRDLSQAYLDWAERQDVDHVRDGVGLREVERAVLLETDPRDGPHNYRLDDLEDTPADWFDSTPGVSNVAEAEKSTGMQDPTAADITEMRRKEDERWRQDHQAKMIVAALDLLHGIPDLVLKICGQEFIFNDVDVEFISVMPAVVDPAVDEYKEKFGSTPLFVADLDEDGKASKWREAD